MTEKHQKAVLNRLSRAIGHMEFVKRMVEDGRDPSEILVQLSAVKAAVNSTGILMIEEEIDEVIKSGDTQRTEALLKAMERYCK